MADTFGHKRLYRDYPTEFKSAGKTYRRQIIQMAARSVRLGIIGGIETLDFVGDTLFHGKTGSLATSVLKGSGNASTGTDYCSVRLGLAAAAHDEVFKSGQQLVQYKLGAPHVPLEDALAGVGGLFKPCEKVLEVVYMRKGELGNNSNPSQMPAGTIASRRICKAL